MVAENRQVSEHLGDSVGEASDSARVTMAGSWDPAPWQALRSVGSLLEGLSFSLYLQP